MSPGSLDHLLLLYLEGNQVHRKGKRHICKQLAACRGEDELTSDPEGAREFMSQRPALKLEVGGAWTGSALRSPELDSQSTTYWLHRSGLFTSTF